MDPIPTTLTEDQEFMWDVLSNNPSRLAHLWANEMMSKKPKILNQMADKHIDYMLKHFSEEEIVRVLKTWLSVYNLPLSPERMVSFENFHRQLGSYIQRNVSSIQPYSSIQPH